tara:strand:+ start:338 stop:1048 length:711 start_codon:yes stop_codon:yes gene_type:complete
MKQTLVLSPGLPRSGSTSLWKLLGLHGIKEPHYLSVLANETDYPSFYPESIRETYCNHIFKMNERRLKLYSPYSLDTYSEYITQQRFDFSQSYWWISERFLEKIKESLDCNIKIILLFREPVARLYSYSQLMSQEWSKSSPLEIFNYYINNKECQTLYSDVNNKFRRVFDDVICLSTEKFFGNPQEYNRLTDFIEMKTIERVNIHENSIDYEPLSDEDIKRAQELLRPSCDFYATI